MRPGTATSHRPGAPAAEAEQVERVLRSWGLEVTGGEDGGVVTFGDERTYSFAHTDEGILREGFCLDSWADPQLAEEWVEQQEPALGQLVLDCDDDARVYVLLMAEVPLADCSEVLGCRLRTAADATAASWWNHVDAERQSLSSQLVHGGFDLPELDEEEWETYPSGWVPFTCRDVYGRAYRTGANRSRVRLSYELGSCPDRDLGQTWLGRQRKPPLGKLELVQLTGHEPHLRLVAELPPETPPHAVDALGDLAQALLKSWDEVSLEAALPVPAIPVNEALRMPPRSAWLCLGDEASYPSPSELARDAERADRGGYRVWTCNAQTQPGDLLLFYFTGERKAVHFAARALSHAYFTGDLRVQAERSVQRHQWWVKTSPFVELDPIPLATLREANHGHLLLKGRSGRYIPAEAACRILQHARPLRPEEDPGVLAPVIASLALPQDLQQWRDLPAGELGAAGARALEARVEDYLVTPLLTLIGVDFRQQMPVQRGVADYVILDSGRPTSVVEVKVRIKEPLDGDWERSPDFRQVMRYSRALDHCPAVLMDSHRVFLIDPMAAGPKRMIERTQATAADLDQIRRHMTGHSATSPRPGRLTA